MLEEFCQVRSESTSLSTKGPHNKGKIREYFVLLSFARLPVKDSHIYSFQRVPRNQSQNMKATKENPSVCQGMVLYNSYYVHL